MWDDATDEVEQELWLRLLNNTVEGEYMFV